MNIQDELQKIHHQFGVSDKANYEIEKLFERFIDEHEQSRQAAVTPATVALYKDFKMNEKKILDACCGSRMMWFDKSHPEAVFVDKRTETHTLCDGRVLEIKPDIEMDFTNLQFADGSFKLVVFDPPHLVKLGEKSWMALKYGKLFPGWEDIIKAGFDECWRVLADDGTLIFKWNENQIKINKIIEVIGQKPLFGHPSGKHGQTIWMTFFKWSRRNGL